MGKLNTKIKEYSIEQVGQIFMTQFRKTLHRTNSV